MVGHGPGGSSRAQRARLLALLAWPLSAPLARGPLCEKRQAHLAGEGPSFLGLGLGSLIPAGSSEQGPHAGVGQQRAHFIPLGLSYAFPLTPAPQTLVS